MLQEYFFGHLLLEYRNLQQFENRNQTLQNYRRYLLDFFKNYPHNLQENFLASQFFISYKAYL